MKAIAGCGELLKASQPVRIAVLAAVAFFIGKFVYDGSYSQLISYSTSSNPSPSSFIADSPIISVLVPSEPPTFLPPPPSAPPPPTTHGIVDENGTMTIDFEVGDLDLDLVERNSSSGSGEVSEDVAEVRVKVKKFRVCDRRMRDYVPCLDDVEAIKELKSGVEKLERRCPKKGLNCLIPAPKGYKEPIHWPRSRDEIWFNNVPRTRLVEEKGGHNWILRDKGKFKFPGGGTDKYLDQIAEMVPDITFGNHIRVALDVGCGVASFGAFLLQRNVLTLSIAPKGVHENQIQFALERGVPAMVAAFATRRLLYPSRAFDLIHCSRCRINWTLDGGTLLLEVNRLLRAGGYFVWAAQPVYEQEAAQKEAWKEMVNLTTRICWELVKREGYIAIWRKPLSNSCYVKRHPGAQPPLCDAEDDPDNVWYVSLKPCISQLPGSGYGENVTAWPARLHEPPSRIQTVEMDSYAAKELMFKAEDRFLHAVVEGFVRVFRWKQSKLRNVMDMKAGFGGLAAALIDLQLDCWVLNVVPVSGPNTLPVIYDRGLIGVAHDWCEPFNTYPRTYDLLHASSLFSVEKKRCNITSILLEMDRILRPRGWAYIFDKKDIIEEIKEITDAMGWRCTIRGTPEGPFSIYRNFMCQKRRLRR